MLKITLNELLNILGQSTKQVLLKDLKASAGINLGDESASYSINQMRQYFHTLFQDDAADLLTNVLRKALARADP